jgi:hypothetical protein
MIGLIPAIVPIIAIPTIFILSLFYHLDGGVPHGAYILLPLGLIAPILYGVVLIRKKLDTAIKIFSIWGIAWFLSCVLFWIESITHFEFLGCWLGPLELIFILPISLHLIPFINIYGEYALVVRVINGAVFMAFFFIGITGLMLIEQAEIQEEIANR